ncbi:hypothetical protein [Streptomyces sp. NPDC059215]|uniref:hypothetical protein n=1 Tax=Streptomyces sp. NPDC059215 TaxID=3346772 RepID=UPI003686A85A
MAAALIGAGIERCAPCRQSLTAKVLEGEPIVLAVTADAAYRLRAPRVLDDEGSLAGPARMFFSLARQANAHGDDARLLLAGVERMPAADRTALLDTVLDLYLTPASAHRGHRQEAVAGPFLSRRLTAEPGPTSTSRPTSSTSSSPRTCRTPPPT